MVSILDSIYSTLANREQFFQGGWGDHGALQYVLANEPTGLHMRPVKEIELHWGAERLEKGLNIREGSFHSPFEFTYELNKEQTLILLPEEAREAHVQMIMPQDYNSQTPLVLQFAATGDEGFDRRRRSMAIPLARKGIGSIILENPYYGARRPNAQKGHAIHDFSSFLRMSRAATDEGLALLRYLKKEEGFLQLGVTGISMGGYVALTAAARSDMELATAACIPCHSAAPVYIDGVLGKSCDWDYLQKDLPMKGDARKFMRDVLDSSDIRTFPKPFRPDATVIIGARKDGYIPNYSTSIVHEYWTGSTLRWVNTGHVGSFVFCIKDFQKAVIDSFSLLKRPKPANVKNNKLKGKTRAARKKARKGAARKQSKKIKTTA